MLAVEQLRKSIRRRLFGGQPASDSFTRADSASSLGGNWIVRVGTGGISSNKGYNAGTGALKAVLGSMSGGNGTIQATLTSADWTNNPIDLFVRETDANNYLAIIFTSATAGSVRSNIGGVLTSLAGFTPNMVANVPTVIKATINGFTIRVFQDGVQLGGDITLTPAQIGALTGTNCGFWVVATSATTTNIDDYSVA